MSILHIAAFRWKPEVTPAEVAELTTALYDMAAEISEVRSYIAGENLRVRPSDTDFGVAAIVDDAAALEAYLDHPAHKAVYERHLGRMIAERTAMQLSIAEGVLA